MQCVDKRGLFLGSSRRQLLTHIARCIARLLAEKSEGLNRYCTFFLGRKSIGKTMILKEVEHACNEILSSRVSVVSTDMSQHSDILTARQMRCPITGRVWETHSGRLPLLTATGLLRN